MMYIINPHTPPFFFFFYKCDLDRLYMVPGVAGRSKHTVSQWGALEGCGVQQIQTHVLQVRLHLFQLTQNHTPLLLQVGLVQRAALHHLRQQLHS